MHEFILEYGLFLAKTITLFLAAGLLIGGLANAMREARHHESEKLEVEPLNERYRRLRETLNEQILDEAGLKAERKRRKREDKARLKAAPKEPRKRLFVLDFDGDLQASAVSELREEITALLQLLRKEDEVLLRLESEGGLVHAYGLAASQLKRLRDRGFPLTVAVDKVAASGGYLMACVADRILAAPFAVVGSIGVVAQIPNVHRLLKKHDVDVELHTAGEYKRTLTLMGENTDAARAKFKEELEDTHLLFKQFVSEHRPQVPIAEAATGEHWFGARALSLNLVDQLRTSDDYLLDHADSADLYTVRFRRKKPLSERLHLSLLRLGSGLRGKALSEGLPPPRSFML
ncbi:protease SohB [Stagnimonas aquatica]|uniref:Protease SohB n=1 Tax=Stagnimonas aquatica TaxID=2689987 RepID=A0A3N0VKS1_9GAMM|nr:protease SohB [Stagnimonas aquatica]ROH93325.1 protease SohB [Stagnimonas aquatica]